MTLSHTHRLKWKEVEKFIYWYTQFGYKKNCVFVSYVILKTYLQMRTKYNNLQQLKTEPNHSLVCVFLFRLIISYNTINDGLTMWRAQQRNFFGISDEAYKNVCHFRKLILYVRWNVSQSKELVPWATKMHYIVLG